MQLSNIRQGISPNLLFFQQAIGELREDLERNEILKCLFLFYQHRATSSRLLSRQDEERQERADSKVEKLDRELWSHRSLGSGWEKRRPQLRSAGTSVQQKGNYWSTICGRQEKGPVEQRFSLGLFVPSPHTRRHQQCLGTLLTVINRWCCWQAVGTAKYPTMQRVSPPTRNYPA